MTKYLLASAMSGASIFLMWLGERFFEDARAEAAATFEIPVGTILLGTIFFLLAGSAFAVILMIRAKRDRRFGYLVAGAVVPAVIVIVPFLWYEGIIPLQSWMRWIESPFVQGASSFTVGIVAAILIWRATGPKRFDEIEEQA